MKVLISGLMNIETTIPVKQFPIEYTGIEEKMYSVQNIQSLRVHIILQRHF